MLAVSYTHLDVYKRQNNVYNTFITVVRFKEGFEMRDLPQISEAEFEVMMCIRDRS